MSGKACTEKFMQAVMIYYTMLHFSFLDKVTRTQYHAVLEDGAGELSKFLNKFTTLLRSRTQYVIHKRGVCFPSLPHKVQPSILNNLKSYKTHTNVSPNSIIHNILLFMQGIHCQNTCLFNLYSSKCISISFQ